MSVQRVADRYAKSLLDLAQEQNKLERVLDDMQSFREVLKNRDFSLLVKSPVVSASKKLSIFKELFSGKYDEMTLAFLRILVTKGREPYLPEIAAEFVAQYKRLKHITTVRVTTAEPLSEGSREAIRKKLAASGAAEDSVELVTIVNPDLIGGFVLEFDGKIYDASIAQKLDELRKEFSGRNVYVSQVSR